MERRKNRRTERTFRRNSLIKWTSTVLLTAAAAFLCGMAAVPMLGGTLVEQGEDSALIPRQAAPVLATQKRSTQPEKPVSEDDAARLLESLREEFPDGSCWNHAGLEDWSESTVTDTPCDHSAYGETACNSYDGPTGELFPQYRPAKQCLGFASMISDRVFGKDAPVAVHRSFDSLRIGDQIRLTSDEHSMVVLEKTEGSVRVVECNADYNSCRISWGREILREELEAHGEELEYITRYCD